MYLERAGQNQVKIFFTMEELEKHGLTKDELGGDGVIWNDFLQYLVEQVCEEFEMPKEELMTIDIFSSHGKEIIFVLTALGTWQGYTKELTDCFLAEKEIYELFAAFRDIEDVIQLALRIRSEVQGGELYFLENHYYLYLTVHNKVLYEKLKHILPEYGTEPRRTISFLREYGKMIMEHSALERLNFHFPTFINSSQYPELGK